MSYKSLIVHAKSSETQHLLAWSNCLITELREWRQLRIDQRQAIDQVGLPNFTNWSDQREQIQQLHHHQMQRRKLFQHSGNVNEKLENMDV